MKDFFEKLLFHAKRRIPAILTCAFLFCIFGLYYLGIYDISFIERPEAWKDNSTLFYNAVDKIFSGDKETESNTSAESEPEPETDVPETDENNTPSKVPNPGNSHSSSTLGGIQSYTVMPTVSELKDEGYKTTDSVYEDGFRFALLETSFELPDIFSFRTKTYDKEIAVQYDDGSPSEVKTETVTEDRPAIELYMGYILYDDVGTLYLIGPDGTVLTKYDDTKYIPAFTRDKEGRPLFYQTYKEEIEYPTELGEPDEEGNTPWLKTAKIKVEKKKYFYLADNGRAFIESDYNDASDNRGLYFDYPSYYGIAEKSDTKKELIRYYKETTKVLTQTVKNKKLTSVFPSLEWLFREKKNTEFDPASEELVFPYTKAYDYSEGYAVVCANVAWTYTDPDLTAAEAAEAKPKEVTAEELMVIDEGGKAMFTSRKSFTSDLGWNANEYYTEPLLKDISSIGSYYFDHGLLRTRLVSYDRYQYIKYNMFMVGTDDDILIYPNGTKFYIPAGYTLEAYSDGMLLLSRDGRYGYMDYTGKWVVEPDLLEAGAFVEGVAAVKNRGGNYGMIDTDGNAVIPFKYDYVSNISSGLVAAYKEDSGWDIYTKMAK